MFRLSLIHILIFILMKYSDFVKRVVSEAGVTQSVAKTTVDAIIKNAVNTDGEVVLNGIGKFSKKVRSARVGINPLTKEKVNIPETNTVVFKVSKEFKDYLNS